MISVRPYTLLCSFDHADIQAVEYVISDMIALVSERNRRVDLIIESSALSVSDIVSAMKKNDELSDKFNKIVAVGDNVTEASDTVPTFTAALAKFPYLADASHDEDLVLIVCGSRAFLQHNRAELEKNVRDTFTY